MNDIIIIGISGKKGSGKDTAATLLSSIISSSTDAYVHIAHFADPLKQLIWDTFSHLIVDPERIWGPQSKKEEVIEGWEISDMFKKIAPYLEKHEYWSGRLLLQVFGTEIFRSIDPILWAKLLCRDIIDSADDDNTTVIIPDVRFDNEVEYLRATFSNVMILKVVRDSVETSDVHVSELGLSDSFIDRTILNNGSIEDLALSLKNL